MRSKVFEDGKITGIFVKENYDGTIWMLLDEVIEHLEIKNLAMMVVGLGKGCLERRSFLLDEGWQTYTLISDKGLAALLGRIGLKEEFEDTFSSVSIIAEVHKKNSKYLGVFKNDNDERCAFFSFDKLSRDFWYEILYSE